MFTIHNTIQWNFIATKKNLFSGDFIVSRNLLFFCLSFKKKTKFHANAIRGKLERAHRSISPRDKEGKKSFAAECEHRYFAFDFCVSPFRVCVRKRENQTKDTKFGFLLMIYRYFQRVRRIERKVSINIYILFRENQERSGMRKNNLENNFSL